MKGFKRHAYLWVMRTLVITVGSKIRRRGSSKEYFVIRKDGYMIFLGRRKESRQHNAIVSVAAFCAEWEFCE